MNLYLALGIFCGGLAVIVMLVRLARTNGIFSTKTGSCDHCGQRSAVIDASYYQNTGLLLMRRQSKYVGRFCRGCSLRVYGKTLLHNVTLGWWGYISFFATWVFLVINTVQAVASLTLPSAAASTRTSLDAHREYALNLLATKDPQTVVEVLSRQTGARPEDVAKYLESLKQAA